MIRTQYRSPVVALASRMRIKSNLLSTSAASTSGRKNVNISHSPVPASQSHLLSEDFLRFLRSVAGEFQPEYRRVLNRRQEWLAARAAGQPISFREDTAWIRNDPTWKAPSIPAPLQKRWVEITGPAGDAKMVINAMNSGANGYMADLEDSQSPDWRGIMQGHLNLYEAVRGQLSFEKNARERYEILPTAASQTALHVRVRGVHMYEHHAIDESNRPMPASLFDIAMYMYHNAASLKEQGRQPFFYIPKLESFEEAVLIHDVIQQVEKRLNLPYGTVRVTALIETLPGILQAEEIGFGLGGYWAGLNCGRWDYIFSVLKSQAKNKDQVFPDRSLLAMDGSISFLTNYMQRIVQVCHARGAHAMGGMSALIPPGKATGAAAGTGSQQDLAERQAVVMNKVRKDKEVEIAAGCDGAWVAHPGMVTAIQEVFNKALSGQANQIQTKPGVTKTFQASDFNTLTELSLNKDGKADAIYTEAGLRTNISVGIQYLAAWLDGRGAVAIQGLMEDLATAEISRTQVWQWLHHGRSFVSSSTGAKQTLDRATFDSHHRAVLQTLQQEIEGNDTLTKEKKRMQILALQSGADLFHSLVTAKELPAFISTHPEAAIRLNCDIEKPKLLKEQFTAYAFTTEEVAKLQGSRPELTLDAKLAKLRGQEFNQKMMEVRTQDGIVAHGNFIGTPNGHSARNVIEGGLGLSWPYVGGWELNARGLVGLEQPMPDTLSVNFHEQGDLARVINRFLDVADKVQTLEMYDKLDKLQQQVKTSNPEQLSAARKALESKQINYLTQPMLADLEQGWGDPKKVFYAVVRCLEAGVNIMHIEDQYSLKRCGHLGGKGLDDLHAWIITMKSANLAACLFAGVERNGGPGQNINFVARTDALSAEFIQYSHHMHDKSHPDHPFIDWERGFTPDGRYLYLKKGINQATGRKYGLEHSARRTAEIVKLGLASHVWMETPDANVRDAQSYIRLVNEHLAPHGKFARGLYNHSPSFVWDVNFFLEAQQLAKDVGIYIEETIKRPLEKKEMSLEQAHWLVKQYLKNHGDRVRGDYTFADDYIHQILGNGLDLAKGEVNWQEAVNEQMEALKKLSPSLQAYKGDKELKRILNNGYKPLRHITNIITAQRLKNFKDRLSDVGFEVHLCTLPLYPSDAYTASRLARGMTETGIHDFVINQRMARKYADATGNLTSFFHQRSTGTGYEVAINSTVGTSNTDILHGSTEAADQEKEQSLKDQQTGPSTYHP